MGSKISVWLESVGIFYSRVCISRDGFATPAMKGSTSDARGPSERAVEAQKSKTLGGNQCRRQRQTIEETDLRRLPVKQAHRIPTTERESSPQEVPGEDF